MLALGPKTHQQPQTTKTCARTSSPPDRAPRRAGSEGLSRGRARGAGTRRGGAAESSRRLPGRERAARGEAPAPGEGLRADPAAAAAPRAGGCGRGKGEPLRLRVGVRSAARTRLLVLLVEFFNHLGRLPSAQTHRNRPRRRSRRAEDAAGRQALCSHTGWAGGPSLGAKARPPRASAAALAP